MESSKIMAARKFSSAAGFAIFVHQAM